MKKLLFVDRYFYPDLQATAVILTDLAREFSKDFEASVICGPASDFCDKRAQVSNSQIKTTTVPSFQFNNPSFFERFLNYTSFLILAPLTLIFHPKSDLVVVQSSPPILPFVISVICRLRRFKYVYVCQDFFPGTATQSGELKESLLTKFFEWLHQIALKHAECVVVIGRDMKELLVGKRSDSKKIEVIQNWADLSEIKALPKSNPYSRLHGLDNYFIVMHSGNFGLVQDFDYLLKLAQALETEPIIRFVFVGGGASKRKITERAQVLKLKNTLFLPFAPREKISEVLASADIHLVSLKKGLAGYSVPSKVYSLLASGRPLIGLLERHSESARTIEDANCGVVFESLEASEVAAYIRELVMKPGQLSDWGRNARAYAEKVNFQGSAFEKYRKIFKETIEKY